ncbi:MAG TPA: LuxR C-terminal-related transcriptional regulator [Thermoanaerobaculia bacterium]|nr:LuxR C-terminal-related transcriptional regulator [Thermoanaerobaculia bacterium]
MRIPAVASSLVATKWLVPSLRPDRVNRVRLREKVAAGRQTVLVSAPAGSGKSVLLADWARTCGEPAAWLSLEPADDDICRFANYLIAALRHAEITTWSELLSPADAANPEMLDAALTDLLNEIAGSARQANLILDDYHVLESPAIHRWLQFAIDHLPPNLRLVIATRADPPLTLSRLRARGELTEIRDADLRFSLSEAADFLNGTMSLALGEREIAELEQRTEGWPVGLQMAALSLQGARDAETFVSRFTGSNRYVLDYLTDEIVAAQHPEVREFLIQTSILDRFSAPLCDAVTERHDGASMLQALETSNLFLVSLDDVRCWFRYHHLFSIVLRHHLERTHDAAFITRLHQRASDWHARSGYPDAAFAHAVAATDAARVHGVVSKHALRLIEEGDSATVARWLRSFTEDDLRNNLDLIVLQASVAAQELRVDDAERHTSRAEELVTGATPAETRAAVSVLRGTLLKLSFRMQESVAAHEQAYRLAEPGSFWKSVATFEIATGAFVTGDVERAEKALRSCRDIDMAERGFAVAMAHAVAARARLLRGDVEDAVALAQEIVTWVARWDRIDHRGQALASFAYAVLGDVHRVRNELAEARAFAEKGVALGRRGFSIGLFESTLTLVQIATAEENWPDVERLAAGVDRVIRNSRWQLFSEAMRWAGYAAALRRALRGGREPELDAVAREVAAAGFDTPPFRIRERQLPGLFTFDAFLVAARVLIARGRVAVAEELLDELIEFNRQRQNALGLVESLILHGIATGNTESMREALELASRPRFVRPFVQEADAARALLERALPRIPDRDFATRVLTAVTGTSTGVELLSARELEVLRLVASGDSNQAAGEKLFISARTVKKHLENVYEKLGVNGRTRAVARARELGLL